MAKYINKTAVVAEIERRIKEHHSGYLVCLKDILSFLDTIEVKEVDLEKESELIANGIMIGVQANKYNTVVYNTKRNDFNHSHLMLAARKGIELGMCNKAQKGELTNVFKYIVKMCDRLINNGNYEADAYTQDTVEDIAELCNRILDGDYGKLVEVKEVQEEPVSEELEKAAFDYAEACKYDGGEKLLCVEHFKAGAKWQKEQFEKERLKHCDELTKEQAQIESDFVVNFIKKNNCTPTFIDAIEYGKKLKLKDGNKL